MVKRKLWTSIFALVGILLLLSSAMVTAQEAIRGTTGGQVLNVRELPDRGSARLAQFPPNTEFFVEARNEAADWLLVYAPAQGVRGWVAIGFITFERAVRVSEEIPVSSEQVAPGSVGAAGNPDAPAVVIPTPTIIPDRTDYPSVYMTDAVWRNVRGIWNRGRQLGNDPWVLMKVGESNTAGTVYLCNFEWRAYSLGSYTHLQGIVDGIVRRKQLLIGIQPIHDLLRQPVGQVELGRGCGRIAHGVERRMAAGLSAGVILEYDVGVVRIQDLPRQAP